MSRSWKSLAWLLPHHTPSLSNCGGEQWCHLHWEVCQDAVKKEPLLPDSLQPGGLERHSHIHPCSSSNSFQDSRHRRLLAEACFVELGVCDLRPQPSRPAGGLGPWLLSFSPSPSAGTPQGGPTAVHLVKGDRQFCTHRRLLRRDSVWCHLQRGQKEQN